MCVCVCVECDTELKAEYCLEMFIGEFFFLSVILAIDMEGDYVEN